MTNTHAIGAFEITKAARKRQTSQYAAPLLFNLTIFALALAQPSCTHNAARKQKLETKLIEAARINNQAASDALNLQPTGRRDEHTATALEFVAQNERVLGAPSQPLSVEPILAERRLPSNSPSNDPALPPGPERRRVGDLFESQNSLLRERRRLADKLEELGARQESQRNARISLWTRLFTFVAGPLGLMVGLLVLVPAAAPILGRLLAWVVGKLPVMAGYIGVVGTKAFDATVRGIELFKNNSGLGAGPSTSKPSPPLMDRAGDGNRASQLAQPKGVGDGVPPIEQLSTALSRSMDGEHKALVRERKRQLP
jgi:hypothetical protein